MILVAYTTFAGTRNPMELFTQQKLFVIMVMQNLRKNTYYFNDSLTNDGLRGTLGQNCNGPTSKNLQYGMP